MSLVYLKGAIKTKFCKNLECASKLLRFPAQQSPPSNHLGISSTSLSLSTIRQVIVTHFDHRVLNALLGIASPCREKFEIAPGKLQGVFQLCCLIATGSCARSLPRGMLQALNIDINKSFHNAKNRPVEGACVSDLAVGRDIECALQRSAVGRRGLKGVTGVAVVPGRKSGPTLLGHPSSS